MNDEDQRREAWNFGLHAEGTRVVFENRATWLRKKIKLRDFVGLAVPICVAYLAGSEIFEPLKHYRTLALGLLGLAAVAQGLLVLWSLISRWDEELAYNIRAARESYQFKESWKRLGRGESKNLAIEYELLQNSQTLADSHDTERGITDSEKQIGMRAGLIEFQRKCVCGVMPSKRSKPWWPKKPCAICGGN